MEDDNLTQRLRLCRHLYRHKMPAPVYDLLTEAIDRIDWQAACLRAGLRPPPTTTPSTEDQPGGTHGPASR